MSSSLLNKCSFLIFRVNITSLFYVKRLCLFSCNRQLRAPSQGRFLMAQKTLLSFFTKKSQDKENSSTSDSVEKEELPDDSPVKATKKRVKKVLEDSDEETEPILKENKVQNETGDSPELKKAEEKSLTPPTRITARKTPKRKLDEALGMKQAEKKTKVDESKVLQYDDDDQHAAAKEDESTDKSPTQKKSSDLKNETKKASQKSGKKNKGASKDASEDDSKPKENSPTAKVHPFFGARNENKEVDDEKETKADDDVKTLKKAQLSTDPGAAYNPAKKNYHPIDDAFWGKDEKVPYLALAKTLEEIENVSSRLKMIEIMANFFRSMIVLSPDDLLHSVYLCLNKIAADYEGIELGIGEMVLMRALAQATGRTVDKIKEDVTSKGDLGIVAEASRSNQRIMFAPPKLTVNSVFHKLKEIAQMSGTSVVNKKIEIIKGMLVACRLSETRYLVRSLSGKLRIGLAEQSVLAALAQAAVTTPPAQKYPPEIIDASKSMSAEAFKKEVQEEALVLKSTYCECPNYDAIISIMLREGISALPNRCHLTPGVPLKPMLASPAKEVIQVLRRFEKTKFTCEFKYDGERAQIHVLDDGTVNIYSRNQENNTSKYPDIIGRMPKILKPDTKSCIIDSEAVAWDREKKQILPFQILSTRKRKDANESDIKVQVCIFAFDMLYLNGESLVKKPFEERRRLLHDSLLEVEGEFIFAKSMDGQTAEDIEVFLEESIKGNCEGLMVKTLDVDATYEIAKRSHNWLKVKKDYLEGVGDTLDVVVIGGYHGKGKRTGTYGGFLLACYDDENEEFQTICKIGTGFTEEQLDSHTNFLKEHVIGEPKSYYSHDSSMTPDEWFEPVQVWEIKCSDLSVSPVHRAAIGIVDPEKGISLRFPRFLRIRDDKKPEDATTSAMVAELYEKQDQVKNQKTKAKVDDEEFY